MFDGLLVRRHVRSDLRRQRSLLVLSAVGVVLVIWVMMVGDAAQQHTQEQVTETGAYRSVTVSSEHIGDVRPVTRDALEEMGRIPGVRQVQPWVQEGFLFTDQSVPAGALWATPHIDVGQPPIVQAIRDPVLPLQPNEVILPDRFEGQALAEYLGDTLEIEYTERSGPETGEPAYRDVRVVGVYDSGFGNPDGPGAAYFAHETAIEIAAAREGVPPGSLGTRVPFPKAIVEAESGDEVLGVQRALTERGFYAESLQGQLTGLGESVTVVELLGWSLLGVVGLYCLGSGISIGANVARTRRRDIGVLTAMGFTRTRITGTLLGELATYGLLAGLVGVAVGTATGAIGSTLLAGENILGVSVPDEILFPDWSILFGLLGFPAAALMLGGVYPAYRAAGLPADTALREE
ncbi:ABC transporter permease [Haloechinothrix sp. LS1_15]|uniref:ABC transporter permease n=1 Tax=Haloechinothrix sp. LS1_15 TaxID=2652248 RepID=UPI0029455E97|nr:ABC transporter permease [Haloechinothrix sp. LS1_15]MDV6011438.1 ABC transporter permease [Haloechinothrix sp. LS1_15]